MSVGVGAGGAGGAAMTVNPGVSFGANAMAAPQTFSRYEPPPNSTPQQTEQGTGGSRGAGGAYDLRAWEKDDLPEEDSHACLGMDVGTSSIKVRGEFYRPSFLWFDLLQLFPSRHVPPSSSPSPPKAV